jgi:glycosyltransferase involved in cell wall biosynthesis
MINIEVLYQDKTDSKENRPKLSIIVPFLNEEKSLPLLKKAFAELYSLPQPYEIVLVCDGATDGSLDFAEQWAAEEINVKVIVFSRNFGHQAAITAGLQYAKGDYIGIIDADLQDPLEILVELYRKACEGWDIVYGLRRRRVASICKQLCYHIFYRVYARLANMSVNIDSGDFCVMNRQAVEALNNLPEKVRFVRGLRAWLGLRQYGLPYDRPGRAAGEVQYSLTKLINLGLLGLSSFSVTPLRLASVGGIVLCISALSLSAFYVGRAVLGDLHREVPGFATMVVLILFLSGLQFMLIGILGEYVGQIFLEVKNRPSFLVKRTINIGSELESIAASQ